MDLYFIALIILVSFFLVTYLVKRFLPGAKTYWIFSMIKTKRFLPVFEKFARFKRVLDFVSVIGLFLGFGAIAVDYYYGKKMKSRLARIGLFLFSALLLYLAFDLFFGPMMVDNPLTGKYYFWFALIFAFTGFAGFTIASLFYNALDILVKMGAGKQACPGVAPIIPGVELPNVPISVPLHGWISILIILVIHEGFHGIQAIRQRISIKNSGLLLLGFLPIGAFVEPKEDEIKAMEKRDAVKVYSAGPSSNLFSIPIIYGVFLLLVFGIVQPFFSPWATAIHRGSVESVFISNVDQNFSFCGEFYESPSFGVIDENWTVLELNGQSIQTSSDFLNGLPPNRDKALELKLLDEQGFEVNARIEPTEIKWYGLTIQDKLKEGVEQPFSYVVFMQSFSFITSFIFWLVLLSLLIGIVNFLPIEPFDGGKIAKIIFPSYLGFWKADDKTKEKVVSKIFLALVAVLLILNALPLFFF